MWLALQGPIITYHKIVEPCRVLQKQDMSLWLIERYPCQCDLLNDIHSRFCSDLQFTINSLPPCLLLRVEKLCFRVEELHFYRD